MLERFSLNFPLLTNSCWIIFRLLLKLIVNSCVNSGHTMQITFGLSMWLPIAVYLWLKQHYRRYIEPNYTDLGCMTAGDKTIIVNVDPTNIFWLGVHIGVVEAACTFLLLLKIIVNIKFILVPICAIPSVLTF